VVFRIEGKRTSNAFFPPAPAALADADAAALAATGADLLAVAGVFTATAPGDVRPLSPLKSLSRRSKSATSWAFFCASSGFGFCCCDVDAAVSSELLESIMVRLLLCFFWGVAVSNRGRREKWVRWEWKFSLYMERTALDRSIDDNDESSLLSSIVIHQLFAYCLLA
jgi:hypothetical protein